MKKFIYEDGNFSCIKEDIDLIHPIHTVDVVIMDNISVKYECENGLLKKPISTINSTMPSIMLKCSCGETEIINGQFKIDSDNYIKPIC